MGFTLYLPFRCAVGLPGGRGRLLCTSAAFPSSWMGAPRSASVITRAWAFLAVSHGATGA
eukprot:4179107-Lingulodinium_polyedra.AAC.1